MLDAKLVSSLEKIFTDTDMKDLDSLTSTTALRGERLSFQVVYQATGPVEYRKKTALSLDGALAEFATIREVGFVTVLRPIDLRRHDDGYLRKTPGIYPDVLRPVHYGGMVVGRYECPSALWVEVDIPKDCAVGKSTLTVSLLTEGEAEARTLSLTVDVIGATLPDESIYYTEWFHCDCLASYYDVKVWSAKHWRIVENYARVAVKNGINMLLTPVFTPPLDTAVGGERPTNQLVGVSLDNGEYTFDFKLLDKWIKMCNRVGVKYFEIAHFFTQWGAAHAPKIMATVDGEYKKLFGWETDATSDEYAGFLRAFIPALLSHLRKSGDDKRCFFHISDEPHVDQLDSYLAAKNIVAPLLEGYPIMDALSNYDFHARGVVDLAIPASDHIEPFIEHGVAPLWTYYCCGQCVGVSNRLIAMPSWRNRSIGLQMYKYDIKGFLQWGYNFYYNCHSGDLINPYAEQDGDYWIPAGDGFSVYPAQDGEALESLRIIVFNEALQDLKALRLLEKYIPKSEIVAMIEGILGFELRFDTCATSAKQILDVRRAVDNALREFTKGE